jgi:peptidoglycan/LPS O-acetylase OafA/YrhL
MAMAMAIYYGFYRYGTLRISRGDVLLPHVAFSLHNIVLNLMNAATSEDSSVQYRFLDVAWALRIEMLFYLAVFGSLCVIRLAPPLARRIGFGGAALGFAAIIAPLFCLSVLGHAPRTFHFLPYFTFGSALYFITLRRSRVAMLVGGLAVPAMIWQFLNAPLTNTAIGAHDNVAAEFAIFAVLLAGMTFLATRRFATGITADRYLGDLTYPLYLYHQNIMIIALSLTAGYSYTVLAIGIAASLVFVCAVHASIDPAIERIRNRVRGRDLRRTGKPVAQPGEADVAIAGLAVSVAPAGGAN